MNNLALGGMFGGRSFAYYETVAGGAGAGPGGAGLSAVHTHMTNTMNTPVEALEAYYPLRVRRQAVRRGSGGRGRHRGGDGIVRELEFLVPTEVTLLAERRRIPPYGLAGGEAGAPGRDLLIRAGRARRAAPRGPRWSSPPACESPARTSGRRRGGPSRPRAACAKSATARRAGCGPPNARPRPACASRTRGRPSGKSATCAPWLLPLH